MKLLGSTKRKIRQDENVSHVEVAEVVLVYCKSPNKMFGHLLDVSPKKSTFLETFDWEFSYIEVCFTDQNSKPIDIEDWINTTVVIN